MEDGCGVCTAREMKERGSREVEGNGVEDEKIRHIQPGSVTCELIPLSRSNPARVAKLAVTHVVRKPAPSSQRLNPLKSNSSSITLCHAGLTYRF